MEHCALSSRHQSTQQLGDKQSNQTTEKSNKTAKKKKRKKKTRENPERGLSSINKAYKAL